jgi:hypothetical protein
VSCLDTEFCGRPSPAAVTQRRQIWQMTSEPCRDLDHLPLLSALAWSARGPSARADGLAEAPPDVDRWVTQHRSALVGMNRYK